MRNHKGVATGIHNAVREQLRVARETQHITGLLLIAMVQQYGKVDEGGVTVTVRADALQPGRWKLTRTESDEGVLLRLTPDDG